MEQEVTEEENKQRQEVLKKKEEIDIAEKRKNEPVNDSNLVRANYVTWT